MKTSNMSDYEEISSNESFEEISDNDSEEKIFLSNEGNKNKSIIDFTEIDSYKKAYNNYSHLRFPSVIIISPPPDMTSQDS